MGQDELIREAQGVLDWVAEQLTLNITCKVIDYKRGNFRVQVLKGDRLIMPIQVTEESLKESNPKENYISEKLRTLLKNLANY